MCCTSPTCVRPGWHTERAGYNGSRVSSTARLWLPHFSQGGHSDMACVTHSVNVGGYFNTVGPVQGSASDGVTPITVSKPAQNVPIGSNLAADAKILSADGSVAWGHGDVNVHNGYATPTAKACTDGLAGHTS